MRLFCLSLLLFFAPLLRATEPVSPERRAAMTDRALAYLVKQQKDSGQVGEARPRAVTALFILATLSAGHLPSDAVYGEALTKAAIWLTDNSSGAFLGGVDEPMADHALAALALSQLVGTFTDKERNRKLYERSKQALGYTLDAQDKGSNRKYTGGWRPTARNSTNDRVLTTWCLFHLHAHKLNQERLSKSSLSRATDFVLASQKVKAKEEDSELGGFAVGADGLAVRSTSAAGLLTLVLFDGDKEKIAMGRDWLLKHPPRWYGPHFYTTNFFAVRALWRARRDDTKAFNKYFLRLLRLLRERQNGDGSFPFPPGHGGPLLAMGKSYSTAMGILILNVDRGFLPIDQ